MGRVAVARWRVFAAGGAREMAVFELDGTSPDLPGNGRYWIAENACVIGRVRLKADTSVWFGSVLRPRTALHWNANSGWGQVKGHPAHGDREGGSICGDGRRGPARPQQISDIGHCGHCRSPKHHDDEQQPQVSAP